ncbi:MAG: stress-induced protein [Thermoanaerobaculia bacterium]|nr:stress-induced protein [Thermoanaerobaculia bacterium]
MANTSRRGFASMDATKQKEIASKGGRAAHAKGTAHEFTSDEARVAGRKGGEAVSRDRAHMSAIGREGGHSRGARARATQPGSNNSDANFSSPERDQQRAPFEGRPPVASDRGDDRPNYAAPDRNNNSNQQRRTERANDNQVDNDRFAGREEI